MTSHTQALCKAAFTGRVRLNCGAPSAECDLAHILDPSERLACSCVCEATPSHPPARWETTGDVETWPTQWATEIMPLAKDALTRNDIEIGPGEGNERTLKCTWPVTFDRSYTQWANQQALAQLGKAGFRLATLLRAVFEPR